MKTKSIQKIADTIRVISAEAIEKANSGHPGMPMGLAEIAAVLWIKYLRYDPDNPRWAGRDRFVLSNGHGSMLLYSLLHLAGFKISLEEIKNFRQWNSLTPGHPESHITPGVECSTGPLGQGIGHAVGMALGNKHLRDRFPESKELFVGKIVCIMGDGCMMEGISAEACSLAGHLKLDNLIVLYDDNGISIAGKTNLTFSENVSQRFLSYGWETLKADGHDIDAIDEAIKKAWKSSGQPILISLKTTIGKGSPGKQNSASVHGSPLGKSELKKLKEGLNWPKEEFFIPKSVINAFATRHGQLKAIITEWNHNFEQWQLEYQKDANTYNAMINKDLPEDLSISLRESARSFSKDGAASRKISQAVLQQAAKEIPSLIGGCADLEPSTLTVISDSSSISAKDFSGRNIHFGVREHAMGAIMNGLAHHGAFIPFGSTFLCFFDYMKPAVRLSALSGLQTIFVYTHDSILLGEDGPTHQPIEHLISLRSIPRLAVFRPADWLETAEAWNQALKRKGLPSAIILSRQFIPAALEEGKRDMHKGAYLIANYKGKGEELILLASGSELPLAVEVAKELSGQFSTKVVSAFSMELFREQEESYKKALFPSNSPIVTIEASSPWGWRNLMERNSHNILSISIKDFGASAPGKTLAKKFGFTTRDIVDKISKWKQDSADADRWAPKGDSCKE